ncbi:MAG: glycosyltransferase family 4 protein [Sphingomonas sp.]
MRILILHNRYQVSGGEDVAVAAEHQLLLARGHEVTLIEADNDAIRGPVAKVRTALAAPYNPARRRWIAREVRRAGAQIVHAHNVFPRFSPSVLDGAADAGAGIVQTLHNYRTICANGLLLRDGVVCEACVGRIGWPAIRHGCYRGSVAGSAAVVAMQQAARWGKIWDRPGRRLIALTEFARDKFVGGGFPADRIVVKPNVIDKVEPAATPHQRAGILFVGRLSREKGADTFVDAAHLLPDVAFTVIGSGPDERRLRAAAPGNVAFTGALSNAAARAAMARASAVVMPSIWYEGFPMTVLEAFAAGTPVIAARIGSLPEIVAEAAGLLFTPDNPSSLAAAIAQLLSDPAAMARMAQAGQERAATLYGPSANAAHLEAIYASVFDERPCG